MTRIEGNCRDVCEAAEFVTIVTNGDDGPHVVRRAQVGDRSAFSELVRRHQERVYRYLLRMLGSHDDALELAQDACVKAWRAALQARTDR